MRLLFAGGHRIGSWTHAVHQQVTEASAVDGRTRVSIHHVRIPQLADAAAEELLDRMRDVMVATACPHDDPQVNWAHEFWQDRRASIRRGSNAYVFRAADGSVVGFFVYRITSHRGRACLHLQSGYILEPYQSRGLALTGNVRAFLRALVRSPLSGIYIVADMGSAIALWGWRKHVASDRAFYPRLPGARAPHPGLVQAATEYAQQHYPTADLEVTTGRLRGRSIPRSGRFADCGQPALDEWFERNMDPQAGDSVLMVIDGSPRVVARHVIEVGVALARVLRSRIVTFGGAVS